MATRVVGSIDGAGRAIGNRRSVCSIGVFDGVHIGHRKLLGEAIGEARSRRCVDVVFTFRNHPLSVLAPAYAPAALTPVEEKIRRLTELGPSLIVVIPFSPELGGMEPETFLREVLRNKLRAVSLWCGRDFRFGHKGRGDLKMLTRFGTRFGLEVRTIEPVQLHGHVVSSTLIRSLIENGAVDRAAECLARYYAVTGAVRPGAGRGRTMHFPTANVEPPPGIVLPGDGIYAAWVEARGRRFKSIVNFGPAPTFDITDRRLEAHLLDYSGDLMDETLVVHFVVRLRDVRRFESAEDLAAQIHADEIEARRIFKSLADDA